MNKTYKRFYIGLPFLLFFTLFITACKKNPTEPNNTAPTASFTVDPTSGTTATVFTFDASGSSDNEDATSDLQVRWDWENDGTYDTNWSTTKITTYQFSTAGTHTVELIVRDTGGLEDTYTKTVNVGEPEIVVIFSDPNFEALIREILGKPSGNITEFELENINSIIGPNKAITNISGIEYCENLNKLDLHNDFDGTTTNDNNIIDFNHLANLKSIHYLDLSFSNISNVSQFSELTNLDTLLLAYNLIGDISPLTNLMYLDLNNNQISDISYISNFNKLQTLVLQLNPISDISVLSNLSNLIWLGLNECQIGDISSLSNLTRLQGVWLSNNQINDIYPLVENQDIGYGDEIQLYNNPLNNISIYEYIPQLQDRGVIVEYDEPETVTDIDGNVYKTVTIGNQVWMAENLKVTHYRNGAAIPNITDAGQWRSMSTGAYCNYDNDINYVSTYGSLYNWYAVDDSRGLAPDGWHIPTDDEWKELEMYLGMSQAEVDDNGWRGTDEGGKLKETGTTHWNSPNTGATNSSGFSALPGGWCNSDGTFYGVGTDAIFWSSTEGSSYGAWYRGLDYDRSGVGRDYYGKQGGCSVRCVRD